MTACSSPGSARVDLRSDTVTLPTGEMLRAMAAAELGDDVYGEDPTVRRLEESAAVKMGKEAALFVPTGTMGNGVAVLTHTHRGDEVICDRRSHVYDAEVGGLAVLAGVQARPLESAKGLLTPGQVASAIRPEDVHFPRSRLLCLENAHNFGGGTVAPPALMRDLCATAHRGGLAVHLDGARIFNAAIAAGVPASHLAEPVDSVMFCLSKGLSAPVGSVLAGKAEWIAEARRARKLLGGGMRQAGVLAAAGIVALETMVERLGEDHIRARRLAEGLAQVPGLLVDLETVQTNMVFVDVTAAGSDLDPSDDSSALAAAFVRGLADRDVLASAVGRRRVRFVTHRHVDDGGVEKALTASAEVMRLGGGR